nr:pericentriolar material 1 protein isoform X2 [Paramormyrops kingsleyae]
MATGGALFDDSAEDQDLANWATSNGGLGLEDRLNNMDWGTQQQKKANRSSEKNKKKVAEAAESLLTNSISPESTPGAGRRQRARTPHSYATQMSVPEQAELERLRQRINFTDLDQRSIGSDSQGRVTAANNQRQLAENKKPFNFLPLCVNTNNSKQPTSATLATASVGKDSSVQRKDSSRLERGSPISDGRGEAGIDSRQVVTKLVQIRDCIRKASSMRDDLAEKADVPANVEHLSHLIDHLKEEEKSYLRFLQKTLAREDDLRALASPGGTSLLADLTPLNAESGHSAGRDVLRMLGAKEDLENPRKKQDLLKKYLEQHEELRALKSRQTALMSIQSNMPQMPPLDDTVVTETTGSVSGLSITSELNDELNDLIQRFHNQLHDTQTKTVPDNRRQAESLSLSREAARGRHTLASAKRATLQQLQDKKETMDKILQELHTLRDQTLNNNPCRGGPILSQRSTDQRTSLSGGRSMGFGRDGGSHVTSGLESSGSYAEGNISPGAKLRKYSSWHYCASRKLKEVHTRLNELRELVQYYEQTSDMMVDAVNENIRDEDEEDSQDGSIFETIFDSEHDNHEPVTNIRCADFPHSRNPPGNWMDVNSLTNGRASNNHDGRLNTDCEINNRSAANLRSFNIPSVIECQYNRDRPFEEVKDGNEEEDEDDEALGDEDDEVARHGDSEGSASSRRSSLDEDAEFAQKVHRLQTAKEKLRHLQELVTMVQSDDTDGTVANEDEGPSQRPNNAPESVKVSPPEVAREELYQARLREQQQELRRLQEERLRLMEIQGKIQDLQWACPDLQSSVSSTSDQGPRKVPAAASTPAVGPTTSSAATATLDLLKPKTDASAPDKELWSEMQRRRFQREELRQRRKQLESLMAEHQRRSGLGRAGLPPDERTMATWGGSTPSHLNEDDEGYPSEMGDEEEEGDYSSNEDVSYPGRKSKAYNGRTSRNSGPKASKPPPVHSSGHPASGSGSQPRLQRQAGGPGGTRRQENLRWASECSFKEGRSHWQEQVGQLKKQLDFSTSMCHTLMQDQQTLSYMLQSLITSPYNMLPGNLGSPQVHLLMHQLNQCYTQLAWQQTNVQRLRHALDELLRQQQQPQPSQQPQQGTPSVSGGPFLPFSLLSMPGLAPFSPLPSGFGFDPTFPPGGPSFTKTPVQQAGGEQQQTPADHNASNKTDYMGFSQAFDRASASVMDTWTQKDGEGGTPSQRSGQQPHPHAPMAHGSLESLSSMPDPSDPTTVTKTFRSGGKASAQASLASRDKTPGSKGRRRRGKGHTKIKGPDSDAGSSGSELSQGLASHSRSKEPDQDLLDRLTRKKLDGKSSELKANEISSACSWRASVHSNSFACAEAQDTSSDLSLFEALRETIYSEVAALISQNESRPHYLIELFHELQQLSTDYLRQRALFSIQDILRRHQAEGKAAKERSLFQGPVDWAATSNLELTPSESLATSDTDGSEKNGVKLTLSTKRNDAESLDNESNQSTPSNHFAKNDLGTTVIHLDKALARMKVQDHSQQQAEGPTAMLTEGASESPDIHCPHIDTQQLDRQIKAIMTEVIPFLKEHMDELCSPQLLSSVRRMVLELTQHNDDSKEFVRFFHRQLGGILQDSLRKFAGQTLKECGEDLLVEISEILFNELAFFRLMQDLDASSRLGGKQKARMKAQATARKCPQAEEAKPQEADEPHSPASHDEDKDQDDTEREGPANNPQPNECGGSAGASDREEEDEDEDGTGLPLSISLSKAETQPLTNYGSGEDEGEEEELEEFETGPVDVQTSLQASHEVSCGQEQGANDVPENSSQEKLDESICSDAVKRSESIELTTVSPVMEEKQDGGASQVGGEGASVAGSAPAALGGTSPWSSPTCSPDTDSPVIINEHEVGSGNLSQKSDEDDFVKVEDLPLQLSVMCKEELQKRIAEEQLNNNLSAEILSTAVGETVLVGNSQALKEPETVGAQSA